MGVAHPFSLRYLEKYLNSLQKQNFRGFDLFLFSHNIQKSKINNFIDKYSKHLNLEYNHLDDKLSISKSREEGLSLIKEKQYDFCIFTDTDDFYHPNFVKSFAEIFVDDECKIAFTDISVYFPNGEILNNYFQEYNIPDEIDINYLIDKNCIGLGHSGIRLDILDKNMPEFPDDIKAVDWWLYSTLMITNNCKAHFIKNSVFYYRQHPDNIAGFGALNKEKVLRGLKIKTLHYKNMMKIDSKFNKYYQIFNEISTKLHDPQNIEFKKQYIDTVLAKFSKKKYLWWEYALQINEL